METLRRDLRFGLRMLARNKGFTAVAILALALGIGPNVAIFSIIWATFLAPLPYTQADQMVVAWTKVKGERTPSRSDDYVQYLNQSKSFQRLDFTSWSELHLTNPDHTDDEATGLPITPGLITQNFRLRMFLGRDFLQQEAVPGNDHVVILTHRLWQEHFHADPNILGKSILIADQPHTVVGVEPPGPEDRTGVLFKVPLALTPGVQSRQWGNIFGRLKPGVTIQQAQAELSLIDRRLNATRSSETQEDSWAISVEPLKNDWLDKKLERNLWLLLAAVGFVLLIACANLANLLLARGSARQTELAVRSAMGATRMQVFTQLLTESLTLAISGGITGILLGWGLMKMFMAILPDLRKMSAEAEVQMNLPVLFFALGVTLLAGILSGCAPALQALGLNLSETLKQGSRSVTARGRMKIQRLLVISEFALAITLLAGAGMALHSFWNLTQIDLGFRTDHILMGRLQPSTRNHASSQQLGANARQLLAKVAAIPGVQSVSLTTNLPLHGADAFAFKIAGRPMVAGDNLVADFLIASPGYFETFGIRLAQGRFLGDSDRAGSPQVVMVSQAFADRFFPGQNPLEQRLLLPGIGPAEKPGAPTEWQIVGIFKDIKNGEHLTDKSRPQIVGCFWQLPLPQPGLAVRTVIDPTLISGTLRDAVPQSMPGYSLNQVDTMQQAVKSQLTGDRFGMVLFGGFAVLALLLAALGIYGVMAFAVAQRNHEIGLRMALGAQRRDVVLLILSDGIKLALYGVGAGLIGVFVLGHLMRSTLYGVKTIDLGSFAAVALTLLAVAVVASWLPARRSAKVDPMIALRQD
jgi:putative ABC transport system permease protein